jgi:NAD+ synthase (glutamine-hydrolysing)
VKTSGIRADLPDCSLVRCPVDRHIRLALSRSRVSTGNGSLHAGGRQCGALAYCNLVGCQVERVFDGNSLIIDESGHVIARGLSFDEDLVIADINTERVFAERLHDPRRRQEKVREARDQTLYTVDVGGAFEHADGRPSILKRPEQWQDGTAEVYAALVMGTRDYVFKNGFDKVYLGLSGGIDSALTAVIAVDAVGPDNVHAVFMPTEYSASESGRDAKALSANLGIHYQVIPIEDTFEGFKRMLEPAFDGLPEDVTEENLQARIRNSILMALSTSFEGWCVDRQQGEMSVGYSTLYGDMVGGFAISGCARHSSAAAHVNHRRLAGSGVISRAPAAELRRTRRTRTSCPHIGLDAILEAYVEKDMSADAIAEMGFSPDTVGWVLARVDAAEYKRRQSAPGIKITPRAFGRDRRMPITNKYHK